MNQTNANATALYESIVAELLERPGVERGTMMGYPCLRLEGTFFACQARSGELVLKLPAERVLALVESGDGEPFAPAGRTFREWVALPTPDREQWRALTDEAVAFATAKAT